MNWNKILLLSFISIFALSGLAAAGNDPITGFFSWSWSAILWFVGLIPFVGPYFSFMLQLFAAVLSEVTFYLYLVIWKYPATIISLILCIIFLHSMAVGKSIARSGKGYIAGMKMIIVIFQDIQTIILLLVILIKMLFQAFNSIITTISDIIQAIKPGWI